MVVVSIMTMAVVAPSMIATPTIAAVVRGRRGNRGSGDERCHPCQRHGAEGCIAQECPPGYLFHFHFSFVTSS
jgi:hypothetical protein